jgi:mannitol-1-phosphate 5-dehydrogenase
LARTAIIFGAGKLGRGFVAEVLQSAGCRLVFVDSDAQRVERLGVAGSYTIYKARKTFYETVPVENFAILHTSAEGEIGNFICEPGALIALAIHMDQLEGIAMLLALAIARKAMETPEEPLDILLCINHIEAKSALRRQLEGLLGGSALSYLVEKVGFVSTVELVVCPTLTENLAERDPLGVLTNGYHEMPVEQPAFKGEPPCSPMLRLSQNIDFEAHRKMFTFNMAYAALAYLGAARGHLYLADALGDERIRAEVVRALGEAAAGFQGEYGCSEKELGAWNESILRVVDNPMLIATLSSLGSDSPRKVGPQDRLVGPALLCQKHGGEPRALARVIAHAYRFAVDGDPRTRAFLRFVEEEGIEQALERYSRLAMRNLLHRMVRAEYDALEPLS